MEKRIQHLLKQFENGQIDQLEKQELLNYANTESIKVSHEIEKLIALQEDASDSLADEKWSLMLQNILSADKPRIVKRHTLFPYLRWAAAIIFLTAASSIVYFKTNRDKAYVFTADIAPGKNKAILTLANGRQISLTDAVSGSIAKQAGVSISKTANGQLVYKITNSRNFEDEHKTNKISTPNGGQWQIELPDGTKIWLNAATSLVYPLSFSGSKERRVELDGEAYFQVAKDKLHPFIVRTAKQEVEVLGTHFNINSYADEQFTKTTLLEGSVRVTKSDSHQTEMLSPGKQAVVWANGIKVTEVDVEESTAWKNGYFMFVNEKQESIMRKVSRWYNVKIEYADPAAREVMYYGTVSRYDHIAKVLRKFEQTGEVRFEIIGSKIIVHKQ
ncbi:MAG: FecR domain-containing protein [Bacteroidota bacterium]